MEVLGIGRTALWRTRSEYLQGGVELAVFDVASHSPAAVRHRCPGACDRWPARRRPKIGSVGRSSSSNARRAESRARARWAGRPCAACSRSDLKAWHRLTCCIVSLSEECRHRMYDLLALTPGRCAMTKPSPVSMRSACNCFPIAVSHCPWCPGHGARGTGQARLRVRSQRHDQSVRGR